MQKNLKNKISFFSFGLLAGVTIGVVFGVAIKAVLGHLNAVNLGILKLGSREDQINQRLDSIEGKLSNQNKKTVIIPAVKPSVKSPDQPTADVTKKATVNSDTVIHDVDNRDSVAINPSDNDSNVVVMTNQLVSVANASVVDLDTAEINEKRSRKKTDSVMASMDDVTESHIANYRIEYWQSPLNFRGYKMSLGRIILYGINSGTPFKLIKLNDVYYLVSRQDAYAVAYTDELKPFDKVTDKTILKKITL